ncbi:MAG TPA: AAA family ATPase [Rhodospirillaceae bacterium]|nr:AAA family ATPase [Rhodospirillaceae bacterium]
MTNQSPKLIADEQQHNFSPVPSDEGCLDEFPHDDLPPPRDPGEIVAQMMLGSVVSATPGLRDSIGRHGTAVVVTVPDVTWTRPIANAWKKLVSADLQIIDADCPRYTRPGAPAFSRPHQILFIRDAEIKGGPEAGSSLVAACLLAGGSVAGFASSPNKQLPAALLQAADLTITVPPPNGELLKRAIANILRIVPTAPLSDDVAGRLSAEDLRLCVRAGEGADKAVHRLRTIVEKRRQPPSLTLDALAGMEEAVTWGRKLARDLALYSKGKLQWCDIDRGALLSGAPGTGKTTFAKALAGSCGVPLVASSLAQWQAEGHLGDLLKAMRRTFDQARAVAPSILFLDELDAFGNRASFSQHKDYSTQVVNGLLELLDGITTREGVVVVGATNNPGGIDPAIKRSGRLDRHIHIDLPDQTALVNIMRLHLAGELATNDLSAAALLAAGSSGADVARWARGARRRAREERRPIEIDDLLDEIRGNTPQISPEMKRRFAVHEAGHSVAAAVYQPQGLKHVTIRQTENTGGGVSVDMGHLQVATTCEIEGALIIALSGRAAEEIVLGSVSTGAGGGIDSDLARATLISTTAVTALGMGGPESLLWSGLPTPETLDLLLARRPDIARAVTTQLETAYLAAKDLIVLRMDVLNLIADRLMEAEALSGKEVLEIIYCDSAPP